MIMEAFLKIRSRDHKTKNLVSVTCLEELIRVAVGHRICQEGDIQVYLVDELSLRCMVAGAEKCLDDIFIVKNGLWKQDQSTCVSAPSPIPQMPLLSRIYYPWESLSKTVLDALEADNVLLPSQRQEVAHMAASWPCISIEGTWLVSLRTKGASRHKKIKRVTYINA
ncbi:uncharacterized protein LOC135367876 [Ornithodoros turicata]|uniref:uncharacterized protein LOC135367876 n=1 Tax=Ornithodoros turicata TaxID=34597 RepID=UPI00313A2DAA